MSTFLIRRSPERAEYLLWSTVVDAPVSGILSREQVIPYLDFHYPAERQANRLARADEFGSSAFARDYSYQDNQFFWREGRPKGIPESLDREALFSAVEDGQE